MAELPWIYPSAARPSCISKIRRFPPPPHEGLGFIERKTVFSKYNKVYNVTFVCQIVTLLWNWPAPWPYPVYWSKRCGSFSAGLYFLLENPTRSRWLQMKPSPRQREDPQNLGLGLFTLHSKKSGLIMRVRQTLSGFHTLKILIDPPSLRHFAFSAFLIFFSAFFSFGVLAGSFLTAFLVSSPLLMTFSPFCLRIRSISGKLDYAYYTTYWARQRYLFVVLFNRRSDNIPQQRHVMTSVSLRGVANDPPSHPWQVALFFRLHAENLLAPFGRAFYPGVLLGLLIAARATKGWHFNLPRSLDSYYWHHNLKISYNGLIVY